MVRLRVEQLQVRVASVLRLPGVLGRADLAEEVGLDQLVDARTTTDVLARLARHPRAELRCDPFVRGVDLVAQRGLGPVGSVPEQREDTVVDEHLVRLGQPHGRLDPVPRLRRHDQREARTRRYGPVLERRDLDAHVQARAVPLRDGRHGGIGLERGHRQRAAGEGHRGLARPAPRLQHRVTGHEAQRDAITSSTNDSGYEGRARS